VHNEVIGSKQGKAARGEEEEESKQKYNVHKKRIEPFEGVTGPLI
jgi:hypothetical protein